MKGKNMKIREIERAKITHPKVKLQMKLVQKRNRKMFRLNDICRKRKKKKERKHSFHLHAHFLHTEAYSGQFPVGKF